MTIVPACTNKKHKWNYRQVNENNGIGYSSYDCKHCDCQKIVVSYDLNRREKIGKIRYVS